MRINKDNSFVQIWASKNDTYNWANRPNNSWPCSTLSNKRFYAEFQAGDLQDMTVNGKYDFDIDGHEFNCFIEDHLGSVNPE